MNAPVRLAELQTSLLRAVASSQSGEPPQADWVLPSRSQSSAERLAVYQNAYLVRLIDCLRESFPVLASCLGREAFNQFAAGYVQRHPPASYTLSHLADHFAEYLVETRPEDVVAPDWPDFLIELAWLEHTIELVFDGPGLEQSPPLDVSGVASLSPDELQRVCLEPAPCLRLLDLQFPLDDYYTAVKRGESPAWPEPMASCLAITRCDYVVRRVPLAPAEFHVLAALTAGQTLGEALASGGEASSAQLAEWFAAWGRLRLFSRLTVSPATVPLLTEEFDAAR